MSTVININEGLSAAPIGMAYATATLQETDDVLELYPEVAAFAEEVQSAVEDNEDDEDSDLTAAIALHLGYLIQALSDEDSDMVRNEAAVIGAAAMLISVECGALLG